MSEASNNTYSNFNTNSKDTSIQEDDDLDLFNEYDINNYLGNYFYPELDEEKVSYLI